LISTNDTTILAMLSRFPDISPEEADEHISKIEFEENVAVCHAVIGRISPDELSGDARQTYNEFHRWSMDRTRRFRNEQLTARQQGKRTRESIRLTQLHQRGLVSDEFMLLYGIQGELPERNLYYRLSDEEKQAIFAERMENRFGPNWRRRFRNLPAFLKEIDNAKINWLEEGF